MQFERRTEASAQARLLRPDTDESSELSEDVRWKYGVPPVGNATFAWVQHFIYREKSV